VVFGGRATNSDVAAERAPAEPPSTCGSLWPELVLCIAQACRHWGCFIQTVISVSPGCQAANFGMTASNNLE
jgi:hypothetical protein